MKKKINKNKLGCKNQLKKILKQFLSIAFKILQQIKFNNKIIIYYKILIYHIVKINKIKF